MEKLKLLISLLHSCVSRFVYYKQFLHLSSGEAKLFVSIEPGETIPGVFVVFLVSEIRLAQVLYF